MLLIQSFNHTKSHLKIHMIKHRTRPQHRALVQNVQTSAITLHTATVKKLFPFPTLSPAHKKLRKTPIERCTSASHSHQTPSVHPIHPVHPSPGRRKEQNATHRPRVEELLAAAWKPPASSSAKPKKKSLHGRES